MAEKLTEEEMRQALFGNCSSPVQHANSSSKYSSLDKALTPKSNKISNSTINSTTSKLRVTLRVGNEFEGKTYEISHDINTLSTLLAEQEARKKAKKKYKYIEVISIKPI